MTEHTTVVVIGAGVAGLTLGNLLLRSGIGCVVLEKHSREYVGRRQRAGTIDSRGVRMFREWGLEEVFANDALPDVEAGFFLDGEELSIDFAGDESVFCPQQVLVRNLTDVFLRAGGDLRFEADDITSPAATAIAGSAGRPSPTASSPGTPANTATPG
ncbi:FAD-dependent monooxygenase [Amycolatopsis sp. FBCC-B4732]|uniref:FAD-dependent monooxygenase n=1 Tax=Amycolatopsis sp. FBCC-B4732 TaxID=3079339 RepID=UPI00248BD7D4|nr:FAD-dependent monooxygenase [Amycolatopsis sp. FBCC-B4732]